MNGDIFGAHLTPFDINDYCPKCYNKDLMSMLNCEVTLINGQTVRTKEECQYCDYTKTHNK